MMTQTSSPGLSRFNLLKPGMGMGGGEQNLGGRFALPHEADTSRHAFSFKKSGAEANAAAQDEPIVGSNPPFTAPGWQVWKYPGANKISKGSGDPIKAGKKKKGTDEEGPESLAGKPHKVVSQTERDTTYVLMFRPLEVQNQVNAAYAELSRKAMVQEVQGDTIIGELAQSGGMITAKQMKHDLNDVDLEAEREFDENMSKTGIVDQQMIPSGPIKTRVQVVNR